MATVSQQTTRADDGAVTEAEAVSEKSAGAVVAAAPADRIVAQPVTATRSLFRSRAQAPLATRPRTMRKRVALGVFLLLVGLPTVLGAIYYGWFASDQYVTEIQFGVRSADAQRNDATQMFQGMAAASQIGLQSNILVQYIKSREMVDAVDKKLDLRRIFSRSSADPLARLDPTTPVEGLVEYWRGKVEPYFDLTTGIVSVKVRAFTAEDSKAIASEVLTLSENLAEDLTKRARADYVRFAQDQVDE